MTAQSPRYSHTVSSASNPMSPRGIVTTPHYLATRAGLDILQRRGSAVDAAIAAAAVLSVVYPHMCGLGGDNFWLVYEAGTGRLLSLNGSGRAAGAATPEAYAQRGCGAVPTRGGLAAVTVPGAVSGWAAAYECSREGMDSPLAWPDLLEAARTQAEEGFAVTDSLARSLRLVTGRKPGFDLHRLPGFSALFGARPDHTPALGDIMRLPSLARTLERLADQGPREFYEGETARAITRAMEDQGGLLAATDLAAHRADWSEPLRVPYRDCVACAPPPNCQGLAALEMLNILNQVDISALGEGTADYYHMLAEATREAFLDRERYLTDPDFARIPTDRLLSRGHAKAQAARISPRRSGGQLPPLPPGGDTVWLGVTDAAGNAVSLIQSIYHEFGSGVVAGEAGFVLQNRGCAFKLDPAHVNCLHPGKRTLHTLTPAMLLREDKPFLVYGSMGGDGQPQTIAALTTRMVDFGLSPQDAVNAPRWLLGRSWGEESNELKLEGRIAENVAQELRRRGHEVRRVADFTEVMGHAGAILRRPNGVWQGAADPRGDGQAGAV